jgi:hypothetical protein
MSGRSWTWQQVAALGVLVCGAVAAIVYRSPEAGLMIQLAQALLPSVLGETRR